MSKKAVIAATLLLFFTVTSSQTLGKGLTRWFSQKVYVPLYSHIYGDDRFKNKPFLLTGTLFIRNTDPENQLTVTVVDYYDSHGKKLKSFIETPITVLPLGSIRYIIPESDSKGGSGAKFLVSWHNKNAISSPIIESVMIGTQMGQGISFVSHGQVIAGESEGTIPTTP